MIIYFTINFDLDFIIFEVDLNFYFKKHGFIYFMFWILKSQDFTILFHQNLLLYYNSIIIWLIKEFFI